MILRRFQLANFKVFIRYFLFMGSFAKKVSSCSFGSRLFGVEFFTIFFCIFWFISSFYHISYFGLYNSSIVWFCILCLSRTLKKNLEHFLPSSSHLMLAQSLALSACLFSKVHLVSFQSLVLTSGLEFSFFI